MSAEQPKEKNHMANQDFSLSGAVKVRPAQQKDAGPLHQFCFPEREQAEIADELKADLAKASQTHRLVAEVSGYPIGQISVKQDANDSEVATVGDLVVSGPFRQLGVADHLMEAAEATAAGDGAKTLEIELPNSEKSVIQRYKDWGFSEKPLVVLQKTLEAAPQEDEETEADAAAEETEENQSDETGTEQQTLLED